VVQNPGEARSNELTQQPPVPYDPRTGPRTLTPFQTMADFGAQGKLKDFRPNQRDAAEPDPEPEPVPEEVQAELAADPTSAPWTSPTGQNPDPLATPETTGSVLLSTSSDSPSPGNSEPPALASAPVPPTIPTPSSQDKANPSS
jgi:hypothetical protein